MQARVSGAAAGGHEKEDARHVEARGLAQAWSHGDTSVLPVLIDALTDLGEDDAVAHLRQPTHVRGCHVIDWILGRQ